MSRCPACGALFTRLTEDPCRDEVKASTRKEVEDGAHGSGSGFTWRRTKTRRRIGQSRYSYRGRRPFYFPFRYDDLKVKDLAEAADQEKLTIKGVVVADPVISRFGPHRSRVNVKLQVERSVILVTFYNQPWLKDRFQMGDEAAVLVSGMLSGAVLPG